MDFDDYFLLFPIAIVKKLFQMEFTLTKWNLLLQLTLFHEGVEGVNRSASMKEAMRPLRSRMPFIKTQPFFQIKKRKNPPGALISVF